MQINILVNPRTTQDTRDKEKNKSFPQQGGVPHRSKLREGQRNKVGLGEQCKEGNSRPREQHRQGLAVSYELEGLGRAPRRPDKGCVASGGLRRSAEGSSHVNGS